MAEKYTDDIIETCLNKAISDNTPDILDDLLQEIEAGRAVQTVPAAESAGVRLRRKRKWYKGLAGCAAALLLFAGTFAAFHNGKEASAVVNLDVNPSIELSLDDGENVMSAKALNEDGRIVLDGMDLEGTDVNMACNALMGSMLKNGYISDISNSVLVSVQSEDERKGRRIEQEISGNINAYFKGTDVSGAVVGQYVDNDDAIDRFARENGISPGKAWLIKNLMATDSKRMTEASLLRLSTQELILLSQERNVKTGDSYGKADTSKYITKEEAMQTAVESLGVDGAGVTEIEAEFDCDDGVILYEVDFVAEGHEYECEINAETGEVMKYDSDLDDGDDLDDDDDFDDDDALDD